MRSRAATLHAPPQRPTPHPAEVRRDPPPEDPVGAVGAGLAGAIDARRHRCFHGTTLQRRQNYKMYQRWCGTSM